MEVSLVVRLIDSYTNKALISGVYAAVEGVKPIYKPDGFIVFTDLPPSDIELVVGGSMFFSEKITVPYEATIQRSVRNQQITNVYLTPNSRYALSSNSAYISCDASAGEKFFGHPVNGIKVIECTDGYITVDYRKSNLEGRLFALSDKTKIYECITFGSRVNGRYELMNPLQSSSPKTFVFPLSLGMADDSGRLFMPIWGVESETKVYLYKGDYVFYNEVLLKLK